LTVHRVAHWTYPTNPYLWRSIQRDHAQYNTTAMHSQLLYNCMWS